MNLRVLNKQVVLKKKKMKEKCFLFVKTLGWSRFKGETSF